MIEQNDQRQRDASMLDALVAQHRMSQNRNRVVNKQPSLLEMPSDAIRGLLGAMQQFGGAADEQIDYYLGPTGIPDKLRAIAPYLDPGFYSGGNAMADIIDPRASASDQFDASRTLSEMAALAPLAFIRGAGGNPITGLLDELPTRQQVTDTARNFMADESGALPMMGSNFANLLGDVGEASTGIRAYQGSPHNFATERLVRMPDGSTQYIVGAPDVLPDVPAGAEVLQDFPLGRLRIDKMGTGEGAQAFGRGLYTAENEGIAKSYRDALADPFESGQTVARAYFNDAGSRAGAVRMLTEQLNGALPNRISLSPDQTSKMREALDFLNSGADVRDVKAPGYMYEVNINADPEDFLDWDLPLAGQTPSIQSAVRGIVPSAPGMASGQRLLDIIAPNNATPFTSAADRARSQASLKLREAGIPGIRYLDAGSRAAGDGSRNYVIFDENLIEIVRKYGIAGAAAMLGLSQADVAQALEQQQQPQSSGLLGVPQ